MHSRPRTGPAEAVSRLRGGCRQNVSHAGGSAAAQTAGKDIVVGYFEPHERKDTIAKTDGLEMIPTKTINYRGVTLQEMDTDAILKRRPAICVVDELAHTNVPGSERSKRWEDVQVLLDAGIDVMTNMNIQHLESLNDQIFHITGVRVRETVPDWLVKSAERSRHGRRDNRSAAEPA